MKLCDSARCTGCHTCSQACPVGCITMVQNREGFWYPQVDEAACLSCGKCSAVCPVMKSKPGQAVQHAYACMHKDEEVRLKSSSGGVFTLLAEAVLRQGGVVFGAAFAEDFSVHHIAVEQLENVEKLRGSKYVQSTIGNAYKECRAYLESGRLVLFTGTPCQIDGLLCFLGKEYDNLLTQDIICHGVAAPAVWQKYIAFREKKAMSKTRRTFFRHKKYGWKTFSVLFTFINNTEYAETLRTDCFMQGYLANLFLRQSCYRCHAKSLTRKSDITLADFWGARHILPDMDDDKGTSLVLISSEKGQRLFDEIQNGMSWKQVDFSQAVSYNSAINKSAPLPQKRDAFCRAVMEMPFDEAIKRHTDPKTVARIKKVCRRMRSLLFK